VRISEIFGPTVQGEGPSAGQAAMFVRLSGCNLSCSWCDTPYTWDWRGVNGTAFDRKAETIRMDVDLVVKAVEAGGGHLVVITGGEPLIQRSELVELCSALSALTHAIEIETNGTLSPPHELWHVPFLTFNVSPKLSNAGMARHQTWKPDIIEQFARSGRAVFKFVLAGYPDLEELDKLVRHVPSLRPEMIWLMPEARDAGTLAARMGAVADAAIERGYNATGRLQVLAWGATRGR
jgi:7-carboxy-7-deazaguanine synthase